MEHSRVVVWPWSQVANAIFDWPVWWCLARVNSKWLLKSAAALLLQKSTMTLSVFWRYSHAFLWYSLYQMTNNITTVCVAGWTSQYNLLYVDTLYTPSCCMKCYSYCPYKSSRICDNTIEKAFPKSLCRVTSRKPCLQLIHMKLLQWLPPLRDTEFKWDLVYGWWRFRAVMREFLHRILCKIWAFRSCSLL